MIMSPYDSYHRMRRSERLRVFITAAGLHFALSQLHTTDSNLDRCSLSHSLCASSTHVMQQVQGTAAHDTQPPSTLSPPPPLCGIQSATRHCHLVAEPSLPHSPTSQPAFTIPLPLPPFPTLLLNPVSFPTFSASSSFSLSSLLPVCCASDAGLAALPSAAAQSMERVHHEKSPVMEVRLTRSRARSLERQAQQEKQQQHYRKQRATSTDKRAAQRRDSDEERREAEVATSKWDNVFQADSTKESQSTAKPPPAPKPSGADKAASPTSAAKAKPAPVESVSDELAQARKEEGWNDFTGEHPITPAPLQPPPPPAASTTSSTTAPSTPPLSAGTAEVVQPTQPMHGAATNKLEQQSHQQAKPSNRKGKVTVTVKSSRPKPTAAADKARRAMEQRAAEEERKEAPPTSYIEETKEARQPEEDNRSLFSTALPSPLSPIERKESPLQWDEHDSALSFEGTGVSAPPSSYTSDIDDKALAWQLQQEEYDAAVASRSIHTFLADLSYQPGWLRLSLAVCLVINVLLPLAFLPNSTAAVTLVCQALQLGFAYWLYRVYDFTPHLLYSTALILPSLLYIVDAHLLQTGWDDVALLGTAVKRRPLLLLDGVVQLYIWQWLSVAVQAVELIGGMWLALKVR